MFVSFLKHKKESYQQPQIFQQEINNYSKEQSKLNSLKNNELRLSTGFFGNFGVIS